MPTTPDRAEPSDHDLAARAGAGDLDAFAALYRRYQQIVYRFARTMTGSADAAADITQEVFVGLITDAGRFDPGRGAFATYLYGIVRNLSRNRLRRERRVLPLEGVTRPRCGETGDGDPLERLAGEELAAAVRRALAGLPSRYRELIVLCDLHGLSYGEAAVVVRTSVGAVRSRLHRGRQLLRIRLAGVVRRQAGSGMAPARCVV